MGWGCDNNVSPPPLSKKNPMSFLKKIGKGLKKAAKGIGKVAKKVVKPISKVVSVIAKPLSKVVAGIPIVGGIAAGAVELIGKGSEAVVKAISKTKVIDQAKIVQNLVSNGVAPTVENVKTAVDGMKQIVKEKTGESVPVVADLDKMADKAQTAGFIDTKKIAETLKEAGQAATDAAVQKVADALNEKTPDSVKPVETREKSNLWPILLGVGAVAGTILLIKKNR